MTKTRRARAGRKDESKEPAMEHAAEADGATMAVAAPREPFEDPDELDGEDLDEDLDEDDGESEDDAGDEPSDDDDADDPVNDPDAPTAPLEEIELLLRRATAAAQGAPVKFRVRAIGKGPHKNLRPVRGDFTPQDIVAAGGSLESAVSKVVRGAPGSYVVELYDPAGKARSTFRRYVDIRASATAEIEEIRAKAEVVRARTQLEEVEQDYEAAAARRRGPADEVLRELRAVQKRISGLEQKPKGMPEWFAALQPVLVPIATELVKRLLAPPPSPAAMLKELGPMMAEAMRASTEMRLEAVRADNRRTDQLTQQLLELAADRGGAPTEDDEEKDPAFALVEKLLDTFRPRQDAAPPRPAEGVVGGPPARVRRPLTPFARFIRGALVRAQQGVAAADAAEQVYGLWMTVPDAERAAFLSQEQIALQRLFVACPQMLQNGMQALLSDAEGVRWAQEFLAALVAFEDGEVDGVGEDAAPADASEPAAAAPA